MELATGSSAEFSYYNTIKVHRLLCWELKKHVDCILHTFPAIESARPRCTVGMQALCSLQTTTDKANLLIQHCTESSKLYLAITAKAILMRCEKIRRTLEICMNQVQNMVPLSLAAKISGIVDELRNTRFCLEPSEYEAGAVILALLQQDISASDSRMQSEIEALRLVGLRLSILSPLALFIEQRSIKKLLGKFNDTNQTKRKILKFLLHLLKKHGKSIWQFQSRSINPQEEDDLLSMELEQEMTEEGETSRNNFLIPQPPEQIKCPISKRVLYDPVVIASGKTFERLWIQKWFDEGNQMCPVTKTNLENLSLTPNLSMKGLISKWFTRHGINVPEQVPPIPTLLVSQRSSSSSIASFGSSMLGLQLNTGSASLASMNTVYSSDSSGGNFNDDSTSGPSGVDAVSHSTMTSSGHESHDTGAAFLSELDKYSWTSQCKVVQAVKDLLEDNHNAQHSIFSSSHVIPVIKFLKDANEICDTKMQKDGAEVLLAILSSSRIGSPPFHEDVVYLLASLLDSDSAGESLAILETLSWQQYYKSRIVASGILPTILKVLDTRVPEHHTLALKILRNLSNGSDVGTHIAYLGYIPKLVSFLQDSNLAGYSIEIINNICHIAEAGNQLAEANIVSSMTTIFEAGKKEEQELAVDLLLSLCSESTGYCQIVMAESIVIQSLVSISVNGSSKGSENASVLLSLLEFMKKRDASQCSFLSSILSQDNSLSHVSSNDSRVKKSSASKTFGRMVKKLSRLLHAIF